jgi:hypothetical protein
VSAPLALAARRALLGAGVLGTALAAHLAAAPGAHVAAGAPLLWLALVAVLALAGPRRGWRPRGVVHTALLAVVLQVAAHAAMSAAPWAFGLSVHHADGISIGPEALVPHLAAAVFLAAAIRLLETALCGVRRIVGALVRWLTPSRPAASGAGARVLPAPGRVLRGLGSRAFASRGPPPVHV